MRKRSQPRLRAGIVTLLAGCLLAHPAAAQVQAQAKPPAPAAVHGAVPVPQEAPPVSRGAVAFDALVVRPLSFIVLPVGVAFFIPAAVVTAPNGKESVQQALELFVTSPANYVFQRPLGEF